MFDTLYIATSGLMGHAAGLRTVGNNLANVNTPGFKASQLQFGALFEHEGGTPSGSMEHPNGTGMETVGSRLLFKAGAEQTTGNPLDLSIEGNGMFAVRRDGQLMYTRSGDFQFNADNVLVNSQGDHVQALDSGGKLVDITLDGLDRSVPHASTSVKFTGNLTSTVATPAVDARVTGIQIFDPQGNSHNVDLRFTDTTGGNYTVTITDSAAGATATALGTGTLTFVGGFPKAGSDKIKFNYSATGVPAFAVELDFSKNVTSLITATTLASAGQDGYGAGVRNDQSIAADGTLTVHYSNGQTAKGARVALADFAAEGDLDEKTGSMFELKSGGHVRYGYAQSESFGTLAAGKREGSNVDLAEEFSNLILMQRGYQASSHVISTANDMIQQLFDMKGNR